MHAQLIAALTENKRQRLNENGTSSSSQLTSSNSNLSLREQIIAQNDMKPRELNGLTASKSFSDLKENTSQLPQPSQILGNRSSPVITRASIAKLQNENKRKLPETTSTKTSLIKEEVLQPSRKKLAQSKCGDEPTSTSSTTTSSNHTATNTGNSNRQFTCLRNMGTTCYINCILQVLRYTPGFTQSIHRLHKKIEYLKLISKEIENELNLHYDVAVVRSLHEILVDMAKEEKKEKTNQRTSAPIILPRKFVRAVWKSLTVRDINWADGSQQDAHEFLQYVIHFINECDVFVRRILQKHQHLPTQSTAAQATPINPEISTKFNLLNNDESSMSSESSNSSTVASTITISSSGSVGSSVSQRSTTRRAASVARQKRDRTVSEMAPSIGLHASTKGGSRDSGNSDSSSTTSNSSQETTSLVLLDDKDIITRKMKAIVNSGITATSMKSKPKTENSCKRPKLDSRSFDDSNFIIIETDSEEECLFLEENPSKQLSSQKNIENVTTDGLKLKNKSPDLKSCQIRLEKISTEEEKVKEKFGLRLSASPQSPPKLEEVAKRETKRIILRTRSKTFPQVMKQPNKHQQEETDIDAIITVSTSTRSTQNSNNGVIETASITRSSSRLSTQTPEKPRDSPIKSTAALNMYSPAELLRKTSTNVGYTCELDKLFRGSSVTLTQCLECENLRKCPESFYDRCIPVDTRTCDQEDDETLNKSQTEEHQTKPRLNWISKCLSNVSYLNENSKYMCDVCNSKQEAIIRTQYTHVPNILILHLMSYGITSSVDGNLNTQKLNTRFRLVKEFDVVCTTGSNRENSNLNYQFAQSPITVRNKIKGGGGVESKLKFRLFAVVMHNGDTLNSGHYTALVNMSIAKQKSLLEVSKNFEEIDKCPCCIEEDQSQVEWLHFDDTKVKCLSDAEFQRKITADSTFDSPYILFYAKEESRRG